MRQNLTSCQPLPLLLKKLILVRKCKDLVDKRLKINVGIDKADLLHESEANHFKDAYRLFLDELYFKFLRHRNFGALYESGQGKIARLT